MQFNEWCKTFKIPLVKYYEKYMGKPCNLDKPKTFTEKEQWLKIYDSTFLKTYCADKITLHDYCKEKLNRDLCIPIIAVYENENQIDFNVLPNAFVIKCNHGSGMNIIIKDKKCIDEKAIRKQLSSWMKIDYTFSLGYELHYKNIPHKIFIEEYKENFGHSDLTDYKFYCFNGNPIFCQVITDRHSGEKISHYDMNWKYKPEYDWYHFNSVADLPKPKHYSEMIEYAKILSKEFKLVRVDFYEIDDKVFLGELTFTPMSGFQKFKDPNIDKTLGDLLKL